ncbi:MAG: hypothetical protein ACYCWE_13420 [Eubacteriales bacterium]
MTELIFCFDTEDFTSNYACDAIRDIAALLESEDIRGCFMTVGLVAKQIVAWERYDVIAALKMHEIDYHTYGHSLHPNICEYTDINDFYLAEKRLLASECEGLGMIKTAFNQEQIYAAVPPGPSVSYAALYTYSNLDIPVYADSPLHTSDGADLYFCNSLHIEYYKSLEELFFSKNIYDMDEFINSLANRKRVIIYNHPNMVLFREFWDSLNYKGVNKHSFGIWNEPERRTDNEVNHFYTSLRNFIRLLKKDGRFTFRTIGDIADKHTVKPRKVTRDMLPELHASLLSHFGYVTEPINLSLSEIFTAVTAFLKGAGSFTTGKSYGFLETPYGVEKSCYVSAAGLLNAANEMRVIDFLPVKIKVGDTDIGPADYLYAALDFLYGETDMICIKPKPQQCSLDEFPYLRDFSLKGDWMYSNDFKDEYLSERLKLQAWTIHR